MKTAQVIRRFNFKEWGGTENVVWNTSRILNSTGDSAEILATNALGGKSFEKLDGADVRRFRYIYPYFPLSSSKRVVLDKKGGNPFVPGLEKYIMSKDFNLIHCHNLGRLGELSARCALKKNIPLILSLHGGYFDIPVQEREELLKPLRGTLPYGGVIERLFRLKTDVTEIASGIICVGENELEELKARFPGKKICFLPNGVSPEKYSHMPNFNWKKELGLSKDTRLLVNISRIDYQKNQMLLLNLMKVLVGRVGKVHLLIVGPPTAEWYYAEMKHMIRDSSLMDYVTIIPGMRPDDPRLTAAYMQADRFILPSLHEPFGIVVLEAWSAGAPVITSNVGGLGRLVTDGVTGIKFESDNLDSLLNAYERSPDRESEICDNAFAEVEQKYDWKTVGAKLRAYYAEVING